MRPNEMDVLPTTFPFLISWGVESGHDKKKWSHCEGIHHPVCSRFKQAADLAINTVSRGRAANRYGWSRGCLEFIRAQQNLILSSLGHLGLHAHKTIRMQLVS